MGRWMVVWTFVVVLSLLISIDNPRGAIYKGSAQFNLYFYNSNSGGAPTPSLSPSPSGLVKDFYLFSCPNAENIIKSTVQELDRNFSNVGPALLRMVFHDCFVQGCDASILLDSVDGFSPEKDAFPNANSLRGYKFIDVIKARLEEACPLTVSCADIIALSARDAVAMTGGPFFALATGRRDGTRSIASVAEAKLPSPDENVDNFTTTFMEMGFEYRDIVSLLGAHTIGRSHCRFFEGRINNFNGTGKPDPTMGLSFANDLRSLCNRNASRRDPLVPMDHGSDQFFDAHYYQNVQSGKGVLHVDQALMAKNETRNLVEIYARDQVAFYTDFIQAMVKLTSLSVLTGQEGEIRKFCSKVKDGGYYTQPEIVP